MEKDDFYKREQDHKWRERTEERIVALTSSESVQNDRLDEIEERFAHIDTLLEGRPDDKNDGGLKGDVHDLGSGLQSLRTLMAPDHLGNGGVLNRLSALEKKAGLEERRLEHRWKFITAVVVAIITSGVLLVKSWPEIKPYFTAGENTALERLQEDRQPAPKKAKKNRGKHAQAPVAEDEP